MAKAFNDNSDVTSNSEQIALLKKHFPQCFDQHGAFMVDKLQALVGDSGTAFSKESYRLNWLGKSYARLLANENPLTFLSEDQTHNQQPQHQGSENLLIKGDNLEVLKHLKNAYREQVKMIYIDPPYNTGSDGFVYQDDRKFTTAQLARLAGIEPDEAQRILDFTQSKANSHSAWLTFMYPRLYVARELLQDDGVIFISIDDNEVAQLRILCDEVFGEENFVANIVWEKRYTRSNNAKKFYSLKDSIICYRKSDLLEYVKEARNEKSDSNYSNPDNDSRGEWTTSSYVNPATKDQRPNLVYEIKRPADNETIVHATHAWKYSYSEHNKHLEDGRLWWGKDGTAQYPRLKLFLSEQTNGLVPIDLWSYKDAGTTDDGGNEIKALFGSAVFDTPKPTKLLSKILSIATKNDSNDIILDFFAGSGTTAHAVMDLNIQDNGNRKFILVQIPEVCNKKSEAYRAGYQTIFDITQARIEKAAERIKADNPIFQGDLGFKLFATVPVPDGYGDELETLASPNSDLFDGSLLDEQQLNDLLTTWKVYDGIALTAPLLPVDLAGYTGWQHQNILYLLQKNFSTAALTALLQKLDDTEDKAFNLERLVLFAHNFDSKHQREISEAMKQYQNRKQKCVSVELRY